MPNVCPDCTETVNTNYSIRTGLGYLCGPDGVTRSLGNIQLARFTFRPSVIDHRRGRDGSLDASIPLSEDYEMELTVDELTPANMAYTLAQDMVQTVSGCEIPFARPDCDRAYGFQFLHTFPCAAMTLQIDMWRALILSEVTIEFGESIINWPITVRSTRCDSTHPTNPYGRALFSISCPSS